LWTFEDPGRDGEVFRYAAGGETLRREKLRETGAGPFGERLAAQSPPRVLSELIHERAEMAAVSDRYLKGLVGRLTAVATLMPVHILLARLGGRREGMRGHC